MLVSKAPRSRGPRACRSLIIRRLFTWLPRRATLCKPPCATGDSSGNKTLIGRQPEGKGKKRKTVKICSEGTCMTCNLFYFFSSSVFFFSSFIFRGRVGKQKTQLLHLVNEPAPRKSWNSLWPILSRNAVPNKRGLSPGDIQRNLFQLVLGERLPL